MLSVSLAPADGFFSGGGNKNLFHNCYHKFPLKSDFLHILLGFLVVFSSFCLPVAEPEGVSDFPLPRTAKKEERRTRKINVGTN
jgi:hypothetical protein